MVSKETEIEKPGFGSRFLRNEEDVWTQNAWDHVQPPPSHSEQITRSLDRQKANPVPEEERGKINDKPAKHWDNFYKTNSNHFFRDRKWLCQEFPVLADALTVDFGEVTIVELGCGAGNTLFPLLETNENSQLKYQAYDYSSHAIKLIQTNPLYSSNASAASASVWDLTSPTLPPSLLHSSADILLLIFVLSALNPSEWNQALINIHKILKKGGKVCIRDYGRYDLAQLRFRDKRWLDENFYVRGDKTRVYFFELDDLSLLFTGSPAPPESYILKSSNSPLIEDDFDLPVADPDPQLPPASLNNAIINTSDSETEADTVTNIDAEPPQDSMLSSSPLSLKLPALSQPNDPLFKISQLGTDRRLIVNRKRKIKMYRVWVQGVFDKL